MELLILNTQFIIMAIFETFESLIWTDRYYSYGDFEIFMPVSDDALRYLQKDNYILCKDSDNGMIIEDLQIESDIENGSKLIVKGRSFETILYRRIIWNQTSLTGNLQDGVYRLLTENIINPSIIDRKMTNFIFEASTDPYITALTINAQFLGESLYDAIIGICQTYNLGFKIRLNTLNQFVFKLYSGVDRSYAQLINPYVIFSPKFDNILNSNYIQSSANMKTVTLVLGEGEGVDRKSVIVGGGVDIDRREIFTDAKSISQNTTDHGYLSTPEYLEVLTQKGNETMNKYIYSTSFEGQVDATTMYKYGEDFSMGDIVQIANEYGMESIVRVTEFIRSQSVSGITMYPTFSKLTELPEIQ